MVRGIEIFKTYFADYPGSYVIIGGTACDIIISASGFKPRATKDIDIILIVEALDSAFAKQFWNFVRDGGYQVKEKSESERQYYRFMKPANPVFPLQLELFSRIPDILDISEESRYTPIPVDENITSLSAILMNEDYYHYTTETSNLQDGVRIAGLETLICLKARAFIDLNAAKEKGEKVDTDKINKHKLDIFRLALFLNAESTIEIPASIKNDLQTFVNVISGDLPNHSIFKEMGIRNLDIERTFNLVIDSFNLENPSK